MRLSLNDISVSFGDKDILKNINFEINTKDKVAIIGRNGSGKSTLLKVITGEQEINGSYQHSVKDKIQKTGKFEIGYIKQIAFDSDDETFENEILKVFRSIIDLKDKIELIEKEFESGKCNKDTLKYEDMLRQYDLLGGYTYQKEYNQAIKKFGFTEEDKYKKLSEFSGGQRTKIALIKLLLSKPDLLILDEPTNHLDITAISWLEEFLASYPKAIIVVSHDRAFLDKFVTIVYEIERNHLTRYVGNYSDFAKKKQLDYEKQLKDYVANEKEKIRLQDLADRFRYKATKASMAQSKLKQIDRMDVIEKPQEADCRVFMTKLKPRVESGNDVLLVDNLSIGYNTVIAKVSFRVQKGDRVGVIGGNGLGKSTLLKTLIGKVISLGGKIKFGTNVEIGYFDQQTATNNIEDISVLDSFLKEFPKEDTESARRILGSFMFSGDDVFKNLKDLSGGELVRLSLCKIFRQQPNLLILDEPTNHMDIVGKEALERMLLDYDGTIIFVSHDRYFVDKLAKSLIVFDENGGRYFKNITYKEYQSQNSEQYYADNKESAKTSGKITPDVDAKKERSNDYYLKKEKARNETKKKRLEKMISGIEDEINNLSLRLVDPEVCSDYVKILEIQRIIDEKNEELDRFMNEWLMLSE